MAMHPVKFLWFTVFFSSTLFAQTGSSKPSVEVSKQQGQFVVQADVGVPAPCVRVWATLTDYDQLANWVPDMQHSAKLTPTDAQATEAQGRILVEQIGHGHFLFFGKTVKVQLWVSETPYTDIKMVLAKGDFLSFTASYNLAPNPTGCQLSYRAQMRPDFFVPPVLGTHLFKQQIERQFTAIAAKAIEAMSAK